MPEVDVCWYEDQEWRGFLPIQPRSELLLHQVFDTWVAGVHHYPEAAQDESFAPGESLALVAEADDRYDAEAIGVWNASRTLMIGHVPAMILANLPPKRAALSLSEQLDAGKRTTLRILVSREPASLRVVPETEERAAWVRSTVVRLKDQAARGLPQETRVEADPLEQMAKTLEDLWGRPPRQPGS